MALTDYIITTYRDNIVDLPDKPSDSGITAAQLKAFFDGRTDDEVKASINGIIETLQALNIEEAVTSNQVKAIRINNDSVIEVSYDGVDFVQTASSGHLIFDQNGNELPQRSRLQFLNTEVTDNGEYTVVQGIQGVAGTSAFTAASSAGYIGTETEFNQSLAQIGDKVNKTVPSAAGNIATLNAAGQLADGGVQASALATQTYVTTAIDNAIGSAIGGSY